MEPSAASLSTQPSDELLHSTFKLFPSAQEPPNSEMFGSSAFAYIVIEGPSENAWNFGRLRKL